MIENKKIKESYITCGYCGTKFQSPIFFGDTDSFDSAITAGNTAQCPNKNCRKMIHCNRKNMSYLLADEPGGFVGDDFSDNKA